MTLPRAWLRCDCPACAENGVPPEPRTLSQRTAKRLLEEHGWEETQGGKHNIKMEKARWRPITLPMHHGNDYSRTLKNAILREAGLRSRGDGDDD